MRDVFMYTGPSGHPLREQISDAGIVRLPPARRGDVERLVSSHPRRPGVIVLVDGVFQDALSVAHAELRYAIQRGWNAWGLSSMGAIRAYEMRFLGMKGFGQVYERFLSEPDFQDDEVALLHAPDEPFFVLSEPLVHIREALADLSECHLLTPAATEAITASLKLRWFGERTLGLLRSLACRASGRGEEVLARLADFTKYRLKTHDVARFVATAPWSALD
jgi:hypothetical protein